MSENWPIVTASMIKSLRKDWCQMTAYEFSVFMGVARNTIYAWEHERRNPTRQDMLILDMLWRMVPLTPIKGEKTAAEYIYKNQCS